eukprot:scaffold28225_cov122-Amphora_coffeaeformis.AAC.1
MAVAVGLPCPQSIFGSVNQLYNQGSLLVTTDIIGVCGNSLVRYRSNTSPVDVGCCPFQYITHWRLTRVTRLFVADTHNPVGKG